MALLTPEEQKRISRSIEEAEKHTGGEIVTAIIPESGDYKAQELLFAIASGVAAYILLVIFSEPLGRSLENWFWMESPVLLPLSMITITLLTGALAYALAQIPVIDRRIIGKRGMAETVRRRALRHFVESAAYDTLDHTGVLLFISVLERRVELIADRGISEKVEASAWENIVNTLVRGIKDKRSVEAIEMAVKSIGELLAEHVPPRPDDIDELTNRPTELEKGS